MKRRLALINVLILCFLLVLSAGQMQAQASDSEVDMNPDGDDVYSDFVADEPDAGLDEKRIEEEARLEGIALESKNGSKAGGAKTAVSSIVPIQGRLTNTNGSPLNGTYSVTARLYDASTGGTVLCEDEDEVTATKGLFNMNMNFCSASDIDGERIYLGIQVGSDPEMSPRQTIYPVPYAWTVKPGAIIKGADSYLFTPGSAFIKNYSSDTTRWTLSYGSAQIYRGADAGNKIIRFPITIPSVLYGQPIRVTHVRVDYRCQDGTQNYITNTYLFKSTDADSGNTLISNDTDRTSNTATSYSLSTNSDYNTLSSSEGSLTVALTLNFNNDSDYIQIGGVRLTLDTNY